MEFGQEPGCCSEQMPRLGGLPPSQAPRLEGVAPARLAPTQRKRSGSVPESPDMGGSGKEAGQDGPQLPGLSPRHLGPRCSSPRRSGGQQLALPGHRTPLWVFWPPRLPRCAGCWVRLTQGPLKCSGGTKATGLPGPTAPGRPLTAQVQGALGSTVPRKLPALKKKTQPNTRPLHTLAWAPTPPEGERPIFSDPAPSATITH